MFVIKEDKSIYLTRGDVAFFSVTAKTDTGEAFKFHPGDIVRFKVFEKKACENVVLSKDFGIEVETEEIEILLEEKDTKIGEVISKPTDYWYEVELNPYTDPQTIIGYDEDGAKIFKLFPEGNEAVDESITPEDIPIVDAELDLSSSRPIQNQAVARAFITLKEDVNRELGSHKAYTDQALTDFNKEIDDTLASFNKTANEKLTVLDERYNEEIAKLEEMEGTVSTLCDNIEAEYTKISESFATQEALNQVIPCLVRKKTINSSTNSIGQVDELNIQSDLNAVNDILFIRGYDKNDEGMIYDARFYKVPDQSNPHSNRDFRWVFAFNLPGTANAAASVPVDFDIYYIPSVMVDGD